jgi:hypothetical protein
MSTKIENRNVVFIGIEGIAAEFREKPIAGKDCLATYIIRAEGILGVEYHPIGPEDKIPETAILRYGFTNAKFLTYACEVVDSINKKEIEEADLRKYLEI